MNISFKVWNRVICVVPVHNTLTYDNIYFQKLRYAFKIGYIIIHNPTTQKHELCNDTSAHASLQMVDIDGRTVN